MKHFLGDLMKPLRSMRERLLYALILLIAATIFHGEAVGQKLDGSLRGTITDTSGAVVVGAKVAATHDATGVTSATTTTDAGTFVLPNLLVGSYTVRVESPNFGKSERSGVNIRNSLVAEASFQLSPQGVTETVDVSADAAVIQTESAQLASTFNTAYSVNLPLTNGGDVRNLALLSGNVVAQPGGVTGAGGSVGGTRPRANSFNIDGLDDNDVSTTGPSSGVIQDAVQEFTILTNQFSAEYGNASGGIFNITSQTGTNVWHGSGFHYLQNRKLQAFDNIQKQSGLTEKPPYDFNRVGGTLGGPAIKNKAFLFGAYEYTQLGGSVQGVEETPTSAGLAALQGIAQNSSVAAILAEFPTAPSPSRTINVQNVNTGTTVAVPVGDFFINVPSPTKTYQYMGNGDVNIGSQQMRFRYNLYQLRSTDVGSDAKFSGDYRYDAHKASVQHVWPVLPTLVNDLRVGYSRTIGPALEGASDPRLNTFPNIAVIELADFTLGPGGNSPQTGFQNVYQLLDQMTWIRGKHTIKVGAEGRSYIATSAFLPRSRGDYYYSTLSQFVSDWTPDEFATRGVGKPTFDGNQATFGGFVQDDLKLFRNFTLSLGLRYDFHTVPKDSKLQALNALATLPGTDLVFREPRSDKNNFSPRFGFAWDPTGSGKWSVRGGYGLSYDTVFQNLALLNLPPQIQGSYVLDAACLATPVPAWCAQYLATGDGQNFLAGGAIPNRLVEITTQTQARGTTSGLIRDYRNPMTKSWSLGIQHEIYKNAGVEVRYVGTRVSGMPVQRQLNSVSIFDLGFPGLPVYFSESQIPATLAANAPSRADATAFRQRPYAATGFVGPVTDFAQDGRSAYDGLAAEFNQNLWHGLTARASYTWSKTLDNATNELNTSTVNPRRPQDMLNLDAEYSRSALDVRHKFAAGWNYALPGFGPNNGFAQRLLRGWELNGLLIAQTGQPVTALSLTDANGNFDAAGDRAILNPNGSGFTSSAINYVCRGGTGASSVSTTIAGCGGAASVVGYVAANPNARFVKAEIGAVTDTGRNNLDSPGLQTWNLSILKNTAITERVKLQLRADIFNAFNHRNYTFGSGTIYNTNGASFGNASYAQVGSVNFGDKTQLNGGARNIQLAMKLSF